MSVESLGRSGVNYLASPTRLRLTSVTSPCAADLRSDVALSLPAGLPSSVLFLCIRHADCRDQSQAQSLPGAAVAAMKTALKVKNATPRFES